MYPFVNNIGNGEHLGNLVRVTLGGNHHDFDFDNQPWIVIVVKSIVPARAVVDC